jgi:2-phospho-L-lactate guanylyltransferase
MSTIAVLPVKRWSSAKQRLEASLSPGERRKLAEAMLIDVLVALRRAQRVDEVLVVTGEPDAAALGQGYDAELLPDPHDAGHSEAAKLGVREAVKRRAQRVLLIAADIPAIEPAAVDALVDLGGPPNDVIVVPDRHGTGTNALLLTPPAAIPPAFGPGSRERHVAAAEKARAKCRVEEPASITHDVDTMEDLDALRTLLDAMKGNAAHTRGLLSHWARR